ncbi:DUF1565 domain-containing protein [bacterium]|nr:DUF1565 domain-containing protein [candidate division CSSED10-310 bacterium]
MKRITVYHVMIIGFFGCIFSAQAELLTVGHTAGFDYKTITHAMAAATAGDRITVAAGTYSADNPEFPEIFPIEMKAGITLIRTSSDVMPVIDANETNRVFSCLNIPETQKSWIEGFHIHGGALTSGLQGGAGIMINNACVSIKDCKINGHSSTGSGGGLSIWTGSKVELMNCTINDNETTHSDSGGGGIYVQSSELTVKTSFIQNNQTLSNGGGIDVYDGKINLWNTSFLNNEAGGSGGGISFGDSSGVRSIEIEQTSFTSNQAGVDGGGVAFSTALQFTPFFGSCFMRDNRAIRNGGGIYISGASPIIAFTSILDNNAGPKGGGVYLNAASPVIICCNISSNYSSTGAGMYVDTSSPVLLNNLMTINHAIEFGGGFYAINSVFNALNLTIADNYAGDAGGAFALNNCTVTLSNSILWGNAIDEIDETISTLTVQCCDVNGGVSGMGNINADPLFVSGINGDYFLSHIDSGNNADSPCINAGCQLSSDISYSTDDGSFRLSESSTRTDRFVDTGQADMGYHIFRNPMECCVFGCMITMPLQDFESGNECYCDVQICNNTFEEYPDIPVFVILDVYGHFFFAPEFDDFSFYNKTIYPGIQYIHVLPRFDWPANAGSADNIAWYAGMTNPEMTELFGEMDSFTFGWH